MSDAPARRLPNVAVAVPIAYGTLAFWLGRKADEFHTHRWNIYVRGLQCEDLSYCIKKVVFTLHPSFANHIRVIEEPPYEVSETGWGEFEVKISIYFMDPHEEHVDIVHALKLYPPGNAPPSTKKPVVHEFYDELVFHEPTPEFHERLLAGPTKQLPRHPHMDFFTPFPNPTESEDVTKLTLAQQFVDEELQNVKDKLVQTEIATQALQAELNALT